MSDLISRRAVLDKLNKCEFDENILGRDDYEYGRYQMHEFCTNIVRNQPSTGEWIPVKWHEIKDAEREEEGYPKEWAVILDCEMPLDEQEILVTTQWGTVSLDVCCEDGEFSLESGWDWMEDIVAWMPLPKPYKGEKDERKQMGL